MPTSHITISSAASNALAQLVRKNLRVTEHRPEQGMSHHAAVYY
jgi:hypothetical protein